MCLLLLLLLLLATGGETQPRLWDAWGSSKGINFGIGKGIKLADINHDN